MDDLSAEGPARFGTTAFYAGLGRAFVAMCGVVPVLAGIELFDTLVGGRLDAIAGIKPREISGLDGLILAPLVHYGFPHLVANAAPLILLGTFVLASGVRRFLFATVLIAIISGLGVWFLTPSSYLVVGASGVIFGWLGMLLVSGIVERSLWSLAVGLVAGLLYGWQVTTLFPSDGQVSWQGHLFGFFGGMVAAIVFRIRQPRAAVTAAEPDAPVTAAPDTADEPEHGA